MFVLIFVTGVFLSEFFTMKSYLQLVAFAIPVTIMAIIITFGLNAFFYPQDFKSVLNKLLRKA